MLTRDAIKARARALGFDLCGVAPVDSHPELSFLSEWLNRGYAGTMTWMEQTAQRRADVRAILPTASTVIVTGTYYNTLPAQEGPAEAGPHDSNGPTEAGPYDSNGPAEAGPYEPSVGADFSRPATATIARYAWGDDYHHVLQARLDALLAWMQEQTVEPFEARAFVDGGPVQERVYAQYAGLGWIGKNTCLINPERGSWLFLGEIICSLPLEADTQGLEQCGSCTRCIEACPTDAIVEAGVLDANRCLSYLTIELRDSIPVGYRAALGAQVYGCDICQAVCPYNEAQPGSTDPAWQPRPGLDRPLLLDLWRQSDDELRALMKGTAMTRAKLPGVRRNVAVAIGNSGDADAVAALAVPYPDRPSVDDPMVQEHVDWALTKNSKL